MTWQTFCSVLIVDDHGGFRAWARAFLEAEGYRVVGEAAGGSDAVGAARRLRPDVVLLDVHLPDANGFDVARQLATAPTPPAVVLVSSREIGEFGARTPAPGVRGFISKVDLTGPGLRALLIGDP